MKKLHIFGGTAAALILAGLVLSILFVATVGQSETVRDLSINAYENEPSLEGQEINGVVITSAEQFADEMTNVIRMVTAYPIATHVLALLFAVAGLVLVKRNPRLSGFLFIFGGIAILYTIVPPILLFIASRYAFKQYTPPKKAA